MSIVMTILFGETAAGMKRSLIGRASPGISLGGQLHLY